MALFPSMASRGLEFNQPSLCCQWPPGWFSCISLRPLYHPFEPGIILKNYQMKLVLCPLACFLSCSIFCLWRWLPVELLPFWCSKRRHSCLTQDPQKCCFFPGVTPATKALVDAGRCLWLTVNWVSSSPFWGEAEMGAGSVLCPLLGGGSVHTLKHTPVLWIPPEASLSNGVNIHSFPFLT